MDTRAGLDEILTILLHADYTRNNKRRVATKTKFVDPPGTPHDPQLC